MIPIAYKNAIQLTKDALQVFADIMEKQRIHNNHDLLSNFFIGKTCTTFYGVCLLCENGYGEDALILVRTMLENLINYCFINLNPEENVVLFIDFDKVLAKKRLNNRKMIFPEKVIPQEKVEAIERGYDEVKDKYKSGSYIQSWSGKNLFDMAINCNLQEYYRIIYPLASSYTHGSVDTSLSYLNKGSSGYSVRLGQPSEELINQTISSACSIIILIIAEACDLYNIEAPSELPKIAASLDLLAIKEIDGNN